MQKPLIEFKKQRDFGQTLGDTFGFIRSEFKPFMSTFFNICGPSLVALLLSMGFYTYVAGDIVLFDPLSDEEFAFKNPILIFISFFAYVFAALAAYVFSVGTTLFYIKNYIDNNGKVSREQVKSDVTAHFWSLLGLGILKWITLFFAAMLCGLPILYAMIPMAVVYSIYVFEPRKSVTDAYSESFYLVNQDFWQSFGTWIVLGVIYYILSLVFSLPAMIYSIIKIGVTAYEVDPTDINGFVDPVYIFLNVLSTFVQFLINIVMMIGGAVIYFHLNEKKNFTGTYERIGKIGENLDQ